ncbi:TetR/AcrR family transcriptional regulator [Protaetiibacter sp. SSC-01]|uniref:TetR/AcrR family transcriptional regulator n=1 Tax=Protaetiibacter sp. SSC-01 TaxID=2759943 RepID=UPI0016569D2E|nr:TetR/AcrR family transcriptional regulator [Protaetiibacter sp. SSC-01]QNO38319.1 TetR/AcrR family transcriptional regulator [Protaetiibacter sp. SSC-01]
MSTTPSETVRAERRRMSPDDRRKQIIDVTAEVFDRTGFANTTMDSVAREIGIAKPTLYHYFSSKDEILQAIHEEFIEQLIHQHEERSSTGLRPEQLLLEAMADILELIGTHRGHVRVFFEHHRDLPTEARARIKARRNDYETIVRDLIRQGMADGVFHEGDVEMATMATFGMCNWAYQWYRDSDHRRPREIAYRFWSILMYGLGSEDARRALDAARPDAVR